MSSPELEDFFPKLGSHLVVKSIGYVRITAVKVRCFFLAQLRILQVLCTAYLTQETMPSVISQRTGATGEESVSLVSQVVPFSVPHCS
jgi:hypothetical protein